MVLVSCRGERYFEVDVDISSSYAASGVVNIVKGATKSMVIDFGVLIEGQVCVADVMPDSESHADLRSRMWPAVSPCHTVRQT